ncbi:BTB/POZ domain-containing protein KCTD6 [Holothuria leucospilota]|uniref:BTB/POZ domain-containing protein KCTD6 n=1 Tax=Holothuria leucospilota TaxID=206669 RepID=A0A9Q0YNR3_HOLLE|nr:BTB/POZ domain-containing protein KCTD6 [Holothuria leucospilota]
MEQDEDRCIYLNIGGKKYKTSAKTIRKYPDSKLAKMLDNTIPNLLDKKGRYFIDRNGEHFQYVLDYMRLGELNLPADSPLCIMLEKEAKFFELPEMEKKCLHYKDNLQRDEFAALYQKAFG